MKKRILTIFSLLLLAIPTTWAAQPAAGEAAPDFELRDQDGELHAIEDYRGKWVALYFYPKDDTPGCTVEAQGLRDSYEQLTEAGVTVFGVSLQDADSHKAFIDKHDLPFPLVVDAGGDVAKAFDVPVKGEYASRHSFLIGKDGKLVKVWREVTPDGHAAEVLAAAKSAS